MKTEATALDGALSLSDLARKCLIDAPIERVGEIEYSLWKVTEPLPAKIPRFSRAFVAWLLGLSFALFAVAAWIVQRTREGDFLPMKVFGVAMIVFMYGGLFGILLLERRRARPPEGAAASPPEGVPARAIAVKAAVRPRGGSVGWLWFDRDALCFRGYGFDFRLRREDFPGKASLIKSFGIQNGAVLRRPKGVSSHWLRLAPGVIVDQAFYAQPKLWSDLESEIAVWESGAFTAEPSLFPPIRPTPTERPALGWREWVAPPLLMGLLLGAASLFFPLPPDSGRTGNPPFVLVAVGILFGLMWPLTLLMDFASRRSTDKEVDRALRKQSTL